MKALVYHGPGKRAWEEKPRPAIQVATNAIVRIISCVTACGKCDYCRKGMYSHCRDGGWILGNTIHGTQAERVRIPHADMSLYHVPAAAGSPATVFPSADCTNTSEQAGLADGAGVVT
jgi:alcohol dehydrogenase